jgi:hypothetical protein
MLTASHSYHFDTLFPQQEGKKVETFISTAGNAFDLRPTSSDCTFLSTQIENSWYKDAIVVTSTNLSYGYTRKFPRSGGPNTQDDREGGPAKRDKKKSPHTHRMRRCALYDSIRLVCGLNFFLCPVFVFFLEISTDLQPGRDGLNFPNKDRVFNVDVEVEGKTKKLTTAWAR